MTSIPSDSPATAIPATPGSVGRPAPSDVACPDCELPVVAGEAFCEACGASLTTQTDAPTPAPTPAPTRAPTLAPVRTHQLIPAASRPPGGGECELCGADVDGDGFCTRCGARARSPRDHWTESPSDWVGGVCDKGIVHRRNEDAMALSSTAGEGFAVLVVCDGVTTAPESDRASLAASRAACDLLGGVPRPVGSFPAQANAWAPLLDAACAAANAETVGVAHALGDPPEPPSCTFVAAVVSGDVLAVAWCGDSRAYWLDDDPRRAEQLSVDHSIGTDLIRGGMSREEAERDPTSHTITRWLGADSVDPHPEYRAMRIDRPGFVAVVSDGMWNYASTPAELRALLDAAIADGATTPTALAESLAAVANDRGGHDNVTVALARCGPPLPS